MVENKRNIATIRKKAFKGLFSDFGLLRKISLKSLKFSKATTDQILLETIFNIDRVGSVTLSTETDKRLFCQYLPELFSRISNMQKSIHGSGESIKEIRKIEKGLRNIEYLYRIILRDLSLFVKDDKNPFSQRIGEQLLLSCKEQLKASGPVIRTVQERSAYYDSAESIGVVLPGEELDLDIERLGLWISSKLDGDIDNNEVKVEELSDENLASSMIYLLGKTSLLDGIRLDRPSYIVNLMIYLIPEAILRLQTYSSSDWEEDVYQLNKAWFERLALYESLGGSFRGLLKHIEKWYDLERLSVRPIVLNKYIS